jgi:hypothetical protein
VSATIINRENIWDWPLTDRLCSVTWTEPVPLPFGDNLIGTGKHNKGELGQHFHSE